MNSILVVCAHADDDVLGCGGVIARHSAAGDEVRLCFMTDGVGAREAGSSAAKARRKAAEKAGKLLGARKIYNFDFPDNRLDTIALIELIQVVESVVSETKADTVYTHFRHDLNVDHRRTHEAVMTACRPQKQTSVSEILSFEVLSSTEWQSVAIPAFQPNVIVDISEHYEKKIAALRCYDTEMREFPHSRSYETVEALAVYRGATHGFQKAEAFWLERLLR